MTTEELAIPNSLVCGITGVEHSVVTSTQNVDKLVEWASNIVKDLDMGHRHFVSLDCEGWNLGCLQKSLGLVQIAECYNEKAFDKDQETPMSLEIKPGFLVRYPSCNRVTEALSSVLTHDNLVIICFDFTNDFSSMMEAGIKIKCTNAFDCHSFGCNGSYFPHRSLREVCEAGDQCIEYGMCLKAMAEKKSIDFDYCFYKYHNDPDPFSRIIDNDFWRYCSNDIVLTALAGISCITKYGVEKVIDYSQKRAEDFMDKVKKYGVLAPSLARQIEFTKKIVTMMKKTNNIKFAYKNFSKAYVLYHSWDLIDPESKKSLNVTSDYFAKCMESADECIKTNTRINH